MEIVARTLGSYLISYANSAGRMFLFWVDIMRKCVTPRFYLAETVRQVYTIGVMSLLLTSTVALSVGLVMAMQTIGTLQAFGAVNYVSVGVGLAVVKELGPVLTGLMVAGRAGSGISAELGSMKVTRQIDALTVSAVNPIRYLVVTRVVACMIAVPLLTIIADVLGVFGGFIIGVTQGDISPYLYTSFTLKYITLSDVIPGLLKTIIFGMLVGTVASYYGFETTGGTEGVGNSTKSSVVTASLLIMISDVILTRILLWIFGS
ncbi:MAG: ABC transporter permease [Candidatus Abyssobacteria bacterium SURF_17]|uniref:ABC transporter permease n=1 Tax=Candidatus Abyssobacteria bacterium SURF_17 TaxID=2093361 RepID=A0A419EX78_9BACT|nr:MAG: ABC transporter permease [Candidatus Abyssubacteria bacterium SURF_17]